MSLLTTGFKTPFSYDRLQNLWSVFGEKGIAGIKKLVYDGVIDINLTYPNVLVGDFTGLLVKPFSDLKHIG